MITSSSSLSLERSKTGVLGMDELVGLGLAGVDFALVVVALGLGTGSTLVAGPVFIAGLTGVGLASDSSNTVNDR